MIEMRGMQNDGILFSQSIFGKFIMQEIEWENLTCKDCGVKLGLKKTNEYEEVKTCPKCGRKVLLIKKIRKNDVGV